MEILLNLSGNNIQLKSVTALHLCRAQRPVHNSISTPDHSKRKQKCLGAMLQRWEKLFETDVKESLDHSTTLIWFILQKQSRNSLLQRRQTLQDCSRLHFMIELDTVSHGKCRNATIMLWKRIHRYRHAKHLSLTPPLTVLIYIKASDSSTVISFLCGFLEQAALFCSVFGCNNMVYPAQCCRRLIYPLSWLQHLQPTDAECTSAWKRTA